MYWARQGVLGLLLGALMALGQPGSAADMPAGVSLRIETGGHGAPIRDLATDRAGVYAVTVSEDKTARVWERASGRLLQVFRPPSGAGNEGKLFAVSMSPDGQVFATSGWSAGNDVYVVARTNGALLHRITGLPNVVTALAFSPDGRHLAVGLWGGHGVRLFAGTNGWRQSRERDGEGAFGGAVSALAWAPEGLRLAVSADDGSLRLYALQGQGLSLRQRLPAEEPRLPHGLAFSPDGDRLAVGMSDRPLAVVHDGHTLALVGRFEIAGAGGGFNAVAWSGDGRQLLMAGSRRDGAGGFTVCRAVPGATSCASERAIARDTVTALKALPGGQLVFASADPAWGVVDEAGQPQVSVVSERVDFRTLAHAFALAPDGASLVVGGPAGDRRAFDLRLPGWSRPGRDWSLPQAEAGGSVVENWQGSARPLVNRRPVALEDNELALSVAVSPRGDRIALGSNFYVRCLDEVGKERWRTPAPGMTWQVNLSADGRWLVAAFSDGSVRWYRVRDGQEQLALLPHPDGRRWVAWVPSGHYAVSPGGEELLGWQVERGPEAGADFFPASRFRASFFQPDVLAAALGQTGESRLPGELAKVAPVVRLPPTVRILSPSDGQLHGEARSVVRLAVQSDGGPVVALRARVNGIAAPLPPVEALRQGRAAQGGEEVFELPLTLPAEGEVDVLVFAENAQGFSPPAAVRLLRPASTPAVPATETPRLPQAVPPQGGEPDWRPALYVLAIGVSRYADPSLQLAFAAKDAQDLSTLLARQEGRLYRKVVTHVLVDEKASRDGVLDGLEWIRRQMTARDVGVVFLAGHGVNDRDGVYYFLPHDTDPRRLKRTAVIFTEIRNTLVSLPGKAIFFVDTCHAGNILGAGLRAAAVDATAVINELATAENGVIVFTATTGRQFAQESQEWGNGAFTKALLEGLSGRADFSRTGRITHKALDFYVSERVKVLTEGGQSPVTIVPGGVPDFPLAIPAPS